MALIQEGRGAVEPRRPEKNKDGRHHDEIPPEGRLDTMAGPDFLQQEAAAVDIQVQPDGVTQDRQKDQQEGGNDGQTASHLEDQAQARQQFQRRQAQGHYRHQGVGQQLELGQEWAKA